MKILAPILLLSSLAMSQMRPPASSGGGAGTPGTQTKFPGTVVTTAGSGDTDWSNPDNVKVEDATVASCDFTSDFGTASYDMDCTNYGFTIPIGSTIDGFELSGKASVQDGSGAVKYGGSYIHASGAGGHALDNQINTTLTTTLTYYTAGSSTDKASQSWTVSQVNASGFGSLVNVADTQSPDVLDIAKIDAVKMKVYYTTAASGGTTRVVALGTIVNGLRLP